ncbi:MAG: endonuclease/exonuclease/phosphatase family protein [Candidatus Levybacteria bacterium]|nr:endonuclease/exonuclease/phosphatase family protein [Candidatus Levybacteria bacterium]
MRKIDIVSFNAFGAPFHPANILRTFLRTRVRKRFRILAKKTKQENIDILVLQEVHTYVHLRTLRTLLPEYRYVIFKKFLFGPRGGLVIFSKTPLLFETYIDFQKKGVLWNKSITGPLSKKGILIAKALKTQLTIINTHLTQNSDHDWSTSNRYTFFLVSQLNQLASLIKTLKKTNRKLIVCGDFNMPKHVSLYSSFMKKSGLIDVFQSETSPTHHKVYMGKKLSSGRIDYIFTTELKPLATDHIFTRKVTIDNSIQEFLSDHIGLRARFQLHYSQA